MMDLVNDPFLGEPISQFGNLRDGHHDQIIHFIEQAFGRNARNVLDSDTVVHHLAYKNILKNKIPIPQVYPQIMSNHLYPLYHLPAQGHKIIIIRKSRDENGDRISVVGQVVCNNGRQFLDAGKIIGGYDNPYMQLFLDRRALVIGFLRQRYGFSLFVRPSGPSVPANPGPHHKAIWLAPAVAPGTPMEAGWWHHKMPFQGYHELP